MKRIISIFLLFLTADCTSAQSEKVKVDVALTVNEMRKMNELQKSSISN